MKLDVAMIGRRLVRIREERGQSLSSVADAAGVAKSYLAKLERGEVENPGLKTLDAVARALDLTLADLISRDATTPAQPPDSDAGERARLLSAAPRSLREFVEQKEASDGELPSDVIRSLVMLQFRGRRPETVEDWQWVYNTLDRGIR